MLRLCFYNFKPKKLILLGVFMSKQKTKPFIESFSEGQYKLTFGQKFYLAIRAGLDFVFALLALIVLSPLFIIVAIAIKVDSKGPVFFVQKRIGKNGKEFNLIKFRSMAQNVNHNLATCELKNAESYITKVGHFIRKFSIDELPQIFNILAFILSFLFNSNLYIINTIIPII